MQKSHRSGAVATLARAFHDDPLFTFLVPDQLSRARAALTFMASILADASQFQEVWITQAEGAIAGVAAWLPPGAYPRGPRREAMGVLRDLRSAHRLGRRVLAGMRIYGAVDQAHAQVPEPHWYLAVIGTDPPSQGRGVGSSLLAPVLERADREGVSAYLETQKIENVSWYRHHGFDVVQELHVRGCPQLWTMSREPK